jgi:hypothetical protein
VPPFQLVRRHKKVTSITHTTLLTISIGAVLGLGHAQVSSVAQEPAKSVPTTGYHAVEKDPGRPSDQVATLCSLRVPDTVSRSRARSGEGTLAAASTIYAPLSPHCKLDLFLKQTYSPYTFASAAFGASEAQATGQWPHFGGGVQG